MSQGPWRFTFTLADVARVAGCPPSRVKRARAAGTLNLADLASVVEWCTVQQILGIERTVKRQRRVATALVLASAPVRRGKR